MSIFRRPKNRAPVPYAADRPTMPLLLSRSDMSMQLDQVLSNPTLFQIVYRTSGAVAQVPWRLFRKRVDGRRVTPLPGETEQRQEITRHAALTLMHTPNPFMSGMFFRELAQIYVEATGEACLVLARDGVFGIPFEWWPVRPDRMQPVKHPTEYLAGWIYTGPNGEKVPLDKRDVIHLKVPNPVDPYRGMSGVAALGLDLDSSRAAAEWNRNFFRNSAEPGGVVEMEEDLDDNEFERFQKRWREAHQGVHNAHRVAILEYGAKWKATSPHARDMQFVELRNQSREIIREGLGIHGHILGLSEDVNRANADAGEVSFARWMVSPRAARWKDMLNYQLLPAMDVTDAEFDHDRIVPEDREADDRERTSRANAANVLVQAGFDPDDVTKAVGLPAMAHAGPAPAPAAPPAPTSGPAE